MLRVILTVVQVFSSVAIIALVLLQRGKGADAGAGFGSGASGTVFGARGATTALSRATAIFAALFMLNSLALTYLGTSTSQAAHRTILDEAGETGKPAPVPSGAARPGATQPSSPAAPAPTPPAPAAPAPAVPPAEQPAGAPGTK